MNVKNSTLVKTYNLVRQIPSLAQAPKALYAFQINLTRLRPIVETIEKTRAELCVRHLGKSEPDNQHPKFAEYVGEYTKILETETEFSPHKFRFDDLNMTINTIAPVILEEIAWMMVMPEEPTT